jgi:tripartite-type tricarboxylate transporter receptor subunit TctC
MPACLNGFFRKTISVLFCVYLLSPTLVIGEEFKNYPNRPIKIIVPLAPGGNLDIVARAIAEPLSKALGQQVVVENKPGASSLLGTITVAKSPPDGYTLLAISTTFITAPLLIKEAGYSPLKDFAPITETC